MEQEELVEYEHKIESILDWADGQENFKTEFVYSVHEQLLTKEFLSPGQKKAIDNIIEKCGISL